MEEHPGTRLIPHDSPRLTLDKIIARVQRVNTMALQTELTEDQLKASKEGKRAIVTLGYALNPDGTMDRTLLGRLQATLKLAKADPDSLIILTVGVPQNHQTEDKLMADWLANHGIDRSRLIEENYASSTVENGLYSAYMPSPAMSAAVRRCSKPPATRRPGRIAGGERQLPRQAAR